MNRDPSRIHVYLADDCIAIRDRVNAMLTAEGMHVAGAAGSPQACVAAILAVRPDVVVLDVQLEGGTGLEVLKAVRACAPEVAFVVFSNNAGPAYRSRYLAQGATGFLDKSREFEQLAGVVASACHRCVQYSSEAR